MLIRPTTPGIWMRYLLWAAAAYNLALGGFAVFFPNLAFTWAGLPLPRDPEIWQFLGMIVGVYGLGYAIAATNPLRHWPVVFMGLIGKLCAPIAFGNAIIRGRLPWKSGWAILTNDVVWLVPFGLILLAAYRANLNAQRTASPEVQKMALRTRTQLGVPLLDMSMQAPVLVVFLRHAGCTFCREALADLAQQRPQIEAAGAKLALVHMSSETHARRLLQKYGLADVARITDPSKHLYRAFGLRRGSFGKLFGPRVLWRGLVAGLIHRHGLGLVDGDAFQMPGVFLVYYGEVLHGFHHQSAADRPDYIRLASLGAF